MRRLSGFASSALAISLLASTAHAHHNVPYALSIEFQPNNPQRVVIAAMGFGMFASDDGGATWRLSCYDALGTSSNASMDDRSLSLLVSSTGLVLTQPGWSIVRSSDGLCTSEEVPLDSLVERPTGSGIKRASDGSIFAMTSLGGDDSVNELWHSDAPGESFSRSGVPLAGPFLASSFVLAASPVRNAAPPPIVNVGGIVFSSSGPGEFAIARTADLGATWNVTPWLPQASGDVLTSRDLIAADPGDPGLLFARETVGVEWSTSQQAIWFSRDAGATWRTLHQGQGPVVGFAYSPDGKTIAIGDSIQGLFHVDVASLTNDDSPSITRVFDYPVWAITWNESGLYAGLNEFQPMTEPQFPTVGVSHDGGRTFAPFMSICDPKSSMCGASSDASSCFEVFRSDFQVASQRCPNIDSGGVGGGGTGGSSAGGGGGGASSTGGASASSGGAPDGGGVSPGESTGGAPPQREELHVTSCAMSSVRVDSGRQRIGFFMLGAAAIALLLRKRDSHDAPAESETSS